MVDVQNVHVYACSNTLQPPFSPMAIIRDWEMMMNQDFRVRSWSLCFKFLSTMFCYFVFRPHQIYLFLLGFFQKKSGWQVEKKLKLERQHFRENAVSLSRCLLSIYSHTIVENVRMLRSIPSRFIHAVNFCQSWHKCYSKLHDYNVK